ncbi:hypothetical protein [Helicobacter pylori]|uniref:hypothetical protein n=1 Tax=Helicobacter pylori TaxID=210 RepID=UPI00165B3E69|nr:hypothetical protein [Helicobacter pylori]
MGKNTAKPTTKTPKSSHHLAMAWAKTPLNPPQKHRRARIIWRCGVGKNTAKPTTKTPKKASFREIAPRYKLLHATNTAHAFVIIAHAAIS